MKRTQWVWLSILMVASAFGQGRAPSQQLQALNVNYMLRGYFFAGSSVEDKSAFGGFSSSENLPKALTPDMQAPPKAISLVAAPDQEVVFARKYKGMKVLLVNTTGEQVAFAAQDSRLNIVQEAFDRDFKWKPVEYLPSSWCGNSYHRVFLNANEYWEFSAPRYTGTLKTRLRFCLANKTADGTPATICSNEFEGSVNPKQFTVQEGHKPTSIMDPYLN